VATAYAPTQPATRSVFRADRHGHDPASCHSRPPDVATPAMSPAGHDPIEPTRYAPCRCGNRLTCHRRRLDPVPDRQPQPSCQRSAPARASVRQRLQHIKPCLAAQADRPHPPWSSTCPSARLRHQRRDDAAGGRPSRPTPRWGPSTGRSRTGRLQDLRNAGTMNLVPTRTAASPARRRRTW